MICVGTFIVGHVVAQPAFEPVRVIGPGVYVAADVRYCFFDDAFDTIVKNVALLEHTIEMFGFRIW